MSRWSRLDPVFFRWKTFNIRRNLQLLIWTSIYSNAATSHLSSNHICKTKQKKIMFNQIYLQSSFLFIIYLQWSTNPNQIGTYIKIIIKLKVRQSYILHHTIKTNLTYLWSTNEVNHDNDYFITIKNTTDITTTTTTNINNILPHDGTAECENSSV